LLFALDENDELVAIFIENKYSESGNINASTFTTSIIQAKHDALLESLKNHFLSTTFNIKYQNIIHVFVSTWKCAAELHNDFTTNKHIFQNANIIILGSKDEKWLNQYYGPTWSDLLLKQANFI